jgi:DNA invertase Pin-like site-specific DNA recombinase
MILRVKSEGLQMLIGYARTSTAEQVAGLEAQEVALGATGCTKLFSERASSVARREGLAAALAGKEVALRILDFGGSEVDTRSPTGRMLLTMFAAVAEFERSILLERQRVGVARARAEGKYKGRAPTARRKRGRVMALSAEGLGASVIAA